MENTSFGLDEKTLQAIASMTGGEYFRARDRAELENIYQALDKYEPVTKEHKTIRHKTPLYHWLLGAAFVLSVLIALQFLFSAYLSRQESKL